MMTTEKHHIGNFFPNQYTGAQVFFPEQWDLCEKVKGENPCVVTLSVSGKTRLRVARDCKLNYCQDNRRMHGALSIKQAKKVLSIAS